VILGQRLRNRRRNHRAYLHVRQRTAGIHVWEQHKHLDIFAARSLAQRNVVHNFTHEILKGTEIYQQLYRTVGIEQLLGIYADNSDTGLFDAISLYRSDPETPSRKNSGRRCNACCRT